MIKGTKSGILKLSKGQMGRAAALHYPLRHLPGIPFAIPLGISVSPGCAFLWLRYPAQLGRSACPDSTPDLHPCCFPACISLSKTVLAAFAPVTIGDKGLCCHCQTHPMGSPFQNSSIPSGTQNKGQEPFLQRFLLLILHLCHGSFPPEDAPRFHGLFIPPSLFLGGSPLLCPFIPYFPGAAG